MLKLFLISFTRPASPSIKFVCTYWIKLCMGSDKNSEIMFAWSFKSVLEAISASCSFYFNRHRPNASSGRTKFACIEILKIKKYNISSNAFSKVNFVTTYAYFSPYSLLFFFVIFFFYYSGWSCPVCPSLSGAGSTIKPAETGLPSHVTLATDTVRAKQ